MEVKKELTQAEADALVKKILFEKDKKYVKAPNPHPVVALMEELRGGGWIVSNDKAIKLTAGNQIALGGLKQKSMA